MPSVSFIFEIILGILVSVASILWLIFPFIVMKRMAWLREELEKANQLLAQISRGGNPRTQALRPTVRAYPTATIVPTVTAVPTARVVSPPSVVPLKISKGGLELGLKDTTSIKVMLKRGELSLKDRYFDKDRNEWVTLDHNPEFS
ncbi:MAG: hypothetical protein LV481_01440 [Methylacidiphilales bacterium]|nr:hypothetical protein [Candidatus Methylacidiphilales bacterium]